MNKPDVCLWDKEFKVRMTEWIDWHVMHSGIENEYDFMKYFMRYSKGHVNPQTVRERFNVNRTTD